MENVSVDVCVVTVARLGVNDEVAQVVQWYVPDEGLVSTGQNICALETTKALYEISAESDGYIVYLVKAGDEVNIGRAIALIGPDIENLRAERNRFVNKAGKESNAPDAPESSINITSKARAAAQKLGVSLSKIHKNGIIRERDVIRCSEQKAVGGRKIIPSQLTWDNSKKPLIIYGAGRGAVTLKECLDFQDDYQVVCFIDDDASHPDNLCDLPVFHSLNLPKLARLGIYSLCCEIADSSVRLQIFEQCKLLQIQLINVIHPRAYISPTVKIGWGNYIKAAAVIETNTKIGNCCIIDNGAVIAHDNIIEDGCHIAPGAAMGSSVRIGNRSIVGIGASIATGVEIGRSVIVAVGSSVVSNIADGSVVEGVPGRVVGKRKS